jgi:hypothetical protein
MFGKKRQLTALEARKRLLLAESELNRAQFLQALQDFKGEILHLTEGVRTVGSNASFVIKAAATFSILQRMFFHRNVSSGKTSWLSRLFKGTKLGTLLLLLLRSYRRKT